MLVGKKKLLGLTRLNIVIIINHLLIFANFKSIIRYYQLYYLTIFLEQLALVQFKIHTSIRRQVPIISVFVITDRSVRENAL